MTHAKADAHPHILPFRLYLTIGSILLVLTLVTVGAAELHFGPWNLVIALVIAGIKGTLVILYFMHLKYDNRLYAIILSLTIVLFLAFLIFTMFDTERRGDILAIQAGNINPHAIIYDATGKPLPMHARIKTEVAPSTPGKPGGPSENFELRHGFGPIKEEVQVGPLDSAMALRGKTMFQMKCATCHKLDDRYTGPPLRGVTAYRSPAFIMNQILDPAQNVAKHPDMQAMLATYYTYMTNQNVTREDARTLVEYLRYEASRPPGSK